MCIAWPGGRVHDMSLVAGPSGRTCVTRLHLSDTLTARMWVAAAAGSPQTLPSTKSCCNGRGSTVQWFRGWRCLPYMLALVLGQPCGSPTTPAQAGVTAQYTSVGHSSVAALASYRWVCGGADGWHSRQHSSCSQAGQLPRLAGGWAPQGSGIC